VAVKKFKNVGFWHERGKEGTGLSKRRMARRGSIIEMSVCITDKRANEWNNGKRRSLNYQLRDCGPI